jgi:hypothetical protein
LKRITFKPEHVQGILDGTKTATFRFTSLRLLQGDVVAAVTRDGKAPAFLVKADDGFARLRITGTWLGHYRQLSDEQLAKTNATHDWYAERSNGSGIGTYYEFELEVPE